MLFRSSVEAEGEARVAELDADRQALIEKVHQLQEAENAFEAAREQRESDLAEREQSVDRAEAALNEEKAALVERDRAVAEKVRAQLETRLEELRAEGERRIKEQAALFADQRQKLESDIERLRGALGAPAPPPSAESTVVEDWLTVPGDDDVPQLEQIGRAHV